MTIFNWSLNYSLLHFIGVTFLFTEIRLVALQKEGDKEFTEMCKDSQLEFLIQETLHSLAQHLEG